MKSEHWSEDEIGVTLQRWLRVRVELVVRQFSRLASERDGVVKGSNSTQANFPKLLLKILQWWIPYVSVDSTTVMWWLMLNFDWNKRGNWRRQLIAKIKSEHWTEDEVRS